MKNLKTFERFSGLSKNYGESYPIKDVKVGSKIIYLGSEYYVIKNNEVSLEISIKPDGKKIILVNQSMFDEKCAMK